MSIRGRNSGLAVLAGERGWIPISGNFIDADDIVPVAALKEGADNAGRVADRRFGASPFAPGHRQR